ncbi:MAG: hypothetical protein WDZ37_04255 [Solirubrobacterales bacterium]
MPTQAQTDLSSSDPGSPGSGWGDMAGGNAARPYVLSLTVINGGVSTPVVTNGTTTPGVVPSGGVTTVVSPFNLCPAGQTPDGSCYSTPNRVGLTVGYGATDTTGYNFGEPSVPVSPTVDANTIFDITVALNTLGKSLRWAWANGDLLYWKTTNLGQDNATVRIKFKPAPQPFVNSYPPGAGCTATPIMNCSIQSADADVLAANMFFSLDDTLDPALTGAIFATKNAISGYLEPGGTAQAPSLDMQVASTHTKAGGAAQIGTLQALIPAAALLNLYGILPGDASTAFSTTRSGASGTNDAPTYEQWTEAAEGSDGLLVNVEGITFSVPAYRVAGKLKRVAVRAKVRGAKTNITASISKCSKRSKCLATVYRLGKDPAKQYIATKKLVLKNNSVKAKKLSLNAPASKLKKGDRLLLVVHSAKKKKKLLASSIATVR